MFKQLGFVAVVLFATSTVGCGMPVMTMDTGTPRDTGTSTDTGTVADSGTVPDTGTTAPTVVGTWVFDGTVSQGVTGTLTYTFNSDLTVRYVLHTEEAAGTGFILAGCVTDSDVTGTYTNDGTTLATTFTAGMRTRMSCDTASANNTRNIGDTGFSAPDTSATYTLSGTSLMWSGKTYNKN